MASANGTAGTAATGKSALLRRFLADRSGATSIEYGLIAALMAVVCIAAFTALGGNSSQGWQGVANKASAAMK